MLYDYKCFLSMWISNTAATLVMLPIALSFLNSFKDNINQKFALILVVSIAYSASIGGISTIIGTPTNAIMISFINNLTQIELSFSWWIVRFFPLCLMLILVMWLYFIIFHLRNNSSDINLNNNFIANQLQDLGKINREEKIIITIFILLIFSWMLKNTFLLTFLILLLGYFLPLYFLLFHLKIMADC